MTSYSYFMWNGNKWPPGSYEVKSGTTATVRCRCINRGGPGKIKWGLFNIKSQRWVMALEKDFAEGEWKEFKQDYSIMKDAKLEMRAVVSGVVTDSWGC